MRGICILCSFIRDAIEDFCGDGLPHERRRNERPAVYGIATDLTFVAGVGMTAHAGLPRQLLMPRGGDHPVAALQR